MHSDEKYYSESRKDFRKERKIAKAKDRSKYKKTDQDKLKKREPVLKSTETLQRGRVLSINLQGIVVDSEGAQFICSLKGALKQESSQLKNLVAVGDFVLFSPINAKEGTISSIEERKSILSRADNLARKKQQLIAVNIDQVLVTVSVVLPSLKSFLVDRYIIAAQKGNMNCVIVVNKIDLLKNPPSHFSEREIAEETALFEDFLKTYRALDIPVVAVSADTKEGIGALKELMKGKTSVFSGQSGVGKSSLINAVLGTQFKVAGIVERTSKGKHTTTTSHLIPLEEGEGFCIDTPGIRSFGIWDLTKEEIQAHFPEFSPFKKECKYLDCNHLNEIECGVKSAVEKEEIPPLRYASYVALMESMGKKHHNR